MRAPRAARSIKLAYRDQAALAGKAASSLFISLAASSSFLSFKRSLRSLLLSPQEWHFSSRLWPIQSARLQLDPVNEEDGRWRKIKLA
jgi:hypothetical protein